MKEFIIKHTWAAISVVITVILIPAIMTYYGFFVPRPQLKFYFEDPFTIGRTSKKIDSLNITYKKLDLKKDSLNVLLNTIRIENTSRAVIKENDYSPEPFGLKVKDCKIIYVEATNDTTNYLNGIINPRIVDTTTIEMDKIPFDCGEHASIDVYVLYKWGNPPDEKKYSSTGSILGGKPFKLLHQIDRESFPTMDDVKGISIVILIEFAIISVIFFSIKLFRRRQIRKKLRPYGIEKLTLTQQELVQLYTKLGKKDFLKLIFGLEQGESFLRGEEEFLDAFRKVNETRKGIFFFIRKLQYFSPFSRSSKFLLKHKLLTEENGKYVVSEELKNETDNILKRFR
jgi:hypothetical protein